jgi:hypothetical protein
MSKIYRHYRKELREYNIRNKEIGGSSTPASIYGPTNHLSGYTIEWLCLVRVHDNAGTTSSSDEWFVGMNQAKRATKTHVLIKSLN